MKIQISDVATGETTIKELTGDELSKAEADHAEAQALTLKYAKKIEEQELARNSAKAKLAALGLDEAEVNALLGGN